MIIVVNCIPSKMTAEQLHRNTRKKPVKNRELRVVFGQWVIAFNYGKARNKLCVLSVRMAYTAIKFLYSRGLSIQAFKLQRVNCCPQ